LTKAGFRIKERRMMPRKVGKNQRITHEESIAFFKDKFNTSLEEN
jgi:hypothetical protein